MWTFRLRGDRAFKEVSWAEWCLWSREYISKASRCLVSPLKIFSCVSTVKGLMLRKVSIISISASIWLDSFWRPACVGRRLEGIRSGAPVLEVLEGTGESEPQPERNAG